MVMDVWMHSHSLCMVEYDNPFLAMMELASVANRFNT
jgi:hypothetical protein